MNFRRLRCPLAPIVTLLLGGCANPLFYHPDRVIYSRPSDQRSGCEEVVFTSSDGTKLHGWFLKAAGEPKGTVLHCHGNAQNVSAQIGFVNWLPAAGFNVFAFDYRGYGRSQGAPERLGVLEDTQAALRYLRGRTDIDQDRLLVFGQSLGGANALVALATETNAAAGIRGIAIDSAFASYRLVVRDKIGQIPVLSLLRWPLSFLVVSDAWSPRDHLRQLPPGVPLLFLRGTVDQVIPPRHSQILFDGARQPKDLWTFKGMNHCEAVTHAEPRAALLHFFESSLDYRPRTTSLPEVTEPPPAPMEIAPR